MSFSSIVKNELCRIENRKKCCMLSELAAALCFSGTASATAGGPVIRVTTENAAFARKIFGIMKHQFGIVPEITIRKSKKLRKHVSYILVVTPALGAAEILNQTGVIVAGSGEKQHFLELAAVDGGIPRRQCCRKAFLRGAFLAGGSVSDPEKTYHLELMSHTPFQAEELGRLLDSFGLKTRVIKRKGYYVTYLKEGENIADFLNIAGAHSSLMELENIRILKGMRNNVNRIVNCETANLEKTVNASMRQVENIRYIARNIGLDKLPGNLREIAGLRLEYNDASLSELGQMLTPPIGKSGVNHRLRRLDEIAERHKEQAEKSHQTS